MISKTIAQPATQLGREVDSILEADTPYERIIFVSAFVALRTILRLRDRLLVRARGGCLLRMTVGVDLGGTSREVLEELFRWNCEAFVFHNALPRATFHPKIYLFEAARAATLFIGSNNLTDGGFYTNYEAAVRHDFSFPADTEQYQGLLAPLSTFTEPTGVTVRRVTAELINALAVRGQLPTEVQARERRRNQLVPGQVERADLPANPFPAVGVPLPPLLPQSIRTEEPPVEQPQVPPPERQLAQRPAGLLVWRKRLPQSDALQVTAGSHHVGGVRLTQASFENPPGQRINQTTYFRNLFREFQWEPEGRRANQERAFVPMRIFIRGRDYGIRNFEISHKPSGEAGQANYTTILRWGRDFTPTVLEENLTDTILSLYETPDADAPFLIEIV